MSCILGGREEFGGLVTGYGVLRGPAGSSGVLRDLRGPAGSAGSSGVLRDLRGPAGSRVVLRVRHPSTGLSRPR